VLPSQNAQSSNRLMSMFKDDDPSVNDEAAQSKKLRTELLKKAVEYSFTHPIFGVGPGQFSIYEGGESVSQGKLGLWHGAHNSYVEISADCGLIAFACYIIGIFGTLILANRTLGQVRRVARSRPDRPELKEMSWALFCIVIGLVGFDVAIFFLNFSYFFYMPALTSIVLALTSVIRSDLARLQPPSAPPFAPAFR